MWNEPMPCWRKARRPHQCNGKGCKHFVAKGDRYLDQYVPWQRVHRRCYLNCAEPVFERAKGYHFFNGRNDWPDRYQQLMLSPKWRQLKDDVIKERGSKCERCGKDGALQLHHRTYAKELGEELPEDVELLCSVCHENADHQRISLKRSALRHRILT